MFEDFKEKVSEHNSERSDASGLPPEIGAKMKAQGLDPQTVTLENLYPESLDSEGNDLSLMSGLEMETWATYWKTRHYLAEKYPAHTQEPDEAPPINIAEAAKDPKSLIYIEALHKAKAIYDKLHILQAQATGFEKICLRHYGHIAYNWTHAPDAGKFQTNLTDTDIFEAVNAYFKICKKYNAQTMDEPFYFLSKQRRVEIKLEGDMLKRTGNYNENEIHVSILEDF